MFVDIIKGFIL